MKQQLRRWRLAALLGFFTLLCTAWLVFDFLFAPLGKDSVSVEIPDVRGQEISGISFADWVDLAVEYRYDADTPAGIILAQSPTAGSRRKLTKTAPRATLTLTVSLGEESLVLPDVRGQDVRVATATLRAQGFAVQTVTVESAYPEGAVLSSSPMPETLLPKGETVTLTVSAGIPIKTVAVPDLCGHSRAEALIALWTSGLSVGEVIETDSDAPSGTVVRQSHRQGSLVSAGTRITLYVSREDTE